MIHKTFWCSGISFLDVLAPFAWDTSRLAITRSLFLPLYLSLSHSSQLRTRSSGFVSRAGALSSHPLAGCLHAATTADGGEGAVTTFGDLIRRRDDGERRRQSWWRCVRYGDDDGDWGAYHDGGRLAYLCCAWQYSALSSWNSIEVGTSRHSVLVDITIAIHIELGMVTGLDRVTWMSFSLRNTCFVHGSPQKHDSRGGSFSYNLLNFRNFFNSQHSNFGFGLVTWHLTDGCSSLAGPRLSLILELGPNFFPLFHLIFSRSFAISINQLYTNTFTQRHTFPPTKD